MKQLSGQDAMFLHSEMEGFPAHIAFVAIYDPSSRPSGTVRFKDILALLESRLDRSSIFRQKLARPPLNLDQPYWIDDERFDLEFHVRHLALPEPGDWRQLCIQLGRLHARSLDRSRPLWETYIIEGLDNVEGVAAGSFCVYTKIHHAAVDGESSMQFLGAMTDLSPVPSVDTEQAAWSARPSPSSFKLLKNAYVNTLRKPWQMARFARAIVPARLRINRGIRTGEFNAPPKPPAIRFNQTVGQHRVVDAISFAFADIKKIKNAVDGATVNDAVLAIVAGGLRGMLIEKQELPSTQLVAGCPVNIREEQHKGLEGNFVGLMTVGLATDEVDPLKRLAQIRESTISGKAHTQAMGAQVALEFADSIPAAIQPMLMQFAASTGLAEKNPMQNTTVSNVPGPPEQLYLCGAKMVKSFSLGLLTPGMGLFHGVSTGVMNQEYLLTIGYLACRDMLPDPEVYTACLKASFEELLAASEAGAVKKPSKEKPKATKKVVKLANTRSKKPVSKSRKKSAKTTS